MDALPTLTVADVVAVDDLGIERAWLPDPTAPVRWVATSELSDPTPFLEGGEILLTTGLGTAEHGPAQWRAYVERLVTVGVSGLGLGVGLTHERAPAALRGAASDVGLDVFEVPPPTPFVAVSRAVAAMLEPAEQAAARLQRDLTQDATDARPRERVTARVAQVLRGACAIVDADGTVLSGTLGIDAATLRSALAHVRTESRRASTTIAGPDSSTAVHPVGLGRATRAFLVATTPGRWSPFQRSAVLTAAAVLSLVESGRAEQRDAEQRLVSAGLALLVAGEPAAADRVLALAHPARTIPAAFHVLALDGPAEAIDAALEHVGSGPDDSAVLAGIVDGQALVIAADTVLDHAVAAARSADAHVGIGTRTLAVEAARGYATACAALARTGTSTPVASWDDEVRAGVASLVPPDAAAAYAADVLGGLRAEHDGTALEETLRTYLEEQGHRGRVAERLGIHRNTVRARMRRVDVLTGRPVADADARADLWFALRVGRASLPPDG